MCEDCKCGGLEECENSLDCELEELLLVEKTRKRLLSDSRIPFRSLLEDLELDK